jgi:hypothetical protein
MSENRGQIGPWEGKRHVERDEALWMIPQKQPKVKE